jgi:diguanylate cyclase (GGDEF)-like protein
LLLEKSDSWLPENLELVENATKQVISRLEKGLLYSSSITDEKTGLYNHRFFQASMLKEFNRSLRTQQPFGLIVVDIDHFKKFNDQYGHHTGDEVLIHVAKVVQRCLRATDTAARFGGEEFCVIAVDTTPAGLSVVMERIRSEVESLKVTTGQHGLLSVTISLGGALMSPDMKTPDALFQKADAALYAAKSQGRNRAILA